MARRIWGKRHWGNGKDQMGRLQQTLALLAVLAAGIAAAALLGGSSYAYNLVSGGTTDTNLSFLSAGPTISSDKSDYAPGSTVTLTGSNWGAGESVHIAVDDVAGRSWSYSTDVTADAAGDIQTQFQLPTAFIANYTVVANGTAGTATASFTDGNLVLQLATAGNAANGVAGFTWRVNWKRWKIPKQPSTRSANCFPPSGRRSWGALFQHCLRCNGRP